MKKGYTIDLSKVGEAKQQITFPIREKVHLWHSNNIAVYQKFIRNFEKMSITNIEFASKLFRLFADNMPKEAEEVWSYFFADNYDERTPSLLDQYETVLDSCLEGDNCFSVDMSSGEVKMYQNSNPSDMAPGEVLFSKKMSDMFYDGIPKRARSYIVNLFSEDGTDEETLRIFIYTIMSVSLISVPKLIENLINKRKQNFNLAYSVAYFMIFDKGLLKMQKKMVEIISNYNLEYDFQTMTDNLTRSFVSTSISRGYNSKADWKEQCLEEDEETAEIIDATLAKTKGKGGRKADFRTIEELCIGNKKEVARLIEQFLEEEQETVSLAYLFYSLTVSSHISCNDYKAFHRALIQAYPWADIKGVTKPQARYSELLVHANILLDDKKFKLYKEYNTDKWKKARKCIKKWLPLFTEIK